jgi:hypothetical protein
LYNRGFEFTEKHRDPNSCTLPLQRAATNYHYRWGMYNFDTDRDEYYRESYNLSNDERVGRRYEEEENNIRGENNDHFEPLDFVKT